MTQSFWQDLKIVNTTTQLKQYDFLIIGAGIAGLSTAYWLLKEDPKLKIGIVEKFKIGFGASGRNAGFITCGSTEHFIKLKDQFGLEKAVEIWKFSEDNRKLLMEHVIEDADSAVDFKITGSCTVAANSERWAYYQNIAQIMRGQNIDVFEVDAKTMDQDFGVTGFEGGIVYAGDGYVHPIKLLDRLFKKIKVHIHEDTEVMAIKKNKDDFEMTTSRGALIASQIIVTTNAYLPLLNPEFRNLIVPGRGQILLTKPLPQFVKGPCYLTKHLCYFRQLPTGELLIGGFRNLAVDAEKTHTDEITPVIQDALFDFVKSHFRYGAKAQIFKQWAGIMGYSPDGQMLIGARAADPHIHYMAGCSGHGMGLSFKAAQTLADSVFKRSIPAHLDIQRFSI